MDKALARCAIIGGIVVFLWGTISWMVLPWHEMTMHKFKNEKKVAQVIQENTEQSGVYVLPHFRAHEKGMSKSEKNEAVMHGKEMMKTGPVIFATVQKNGMKMEGPLPFVLALIVQIIAAYLITWLLLMTKVMPYMRQVGFVTTIALIAGIITYVPDLIWGGAAFGFTIVCMLDLIIGWFLGGLVIAKLARK